MKIAKTVCRCAWVMLFVLGMGIVAPSTAAASTDGRITVSQEARVQGDTIRLGDIATLEGELGVIHKLESVPVGRAPLAGKERRVSREQIVAALRQQGFDAKNIDLSCPREIKVLGDYQEVSIEDLEAIIRSHIFANMPWEKHAVVIENFTAKPVQLPLGDITHHVVVQPGEDYLGKFNADVIFKVNGCEIQRTRASAVIRVTVPVAVSAKAIDRHALLSPEAIIMEPKDLATLPKGVITDINCLTNRRAKISITAGTLLRQDMFEADTDIRRGDIVTISLTTPLFSITVPGEALESGNRGEVIPVANLSSKNKVYGSVKNNKEVEVRY